MSKTVKIKERKGTDHKHERDDAQITKHRLREGQRGPEKDRDEGQYHHSDVEAADLLLLVVHDLWNVLGILWVEDPKEEGPALQTTATISTSGNGSTKELEHVPKQS